MKFAIFSSATFSLRNRRMPRWGWFALSAVLWLGPEADVNACVTGDRLKIGQSIDLSGPQRFAGIEFTEGANLLFRRINKAGGIRGRKIDLVSVDDKFDPRVTAENVAALTQANGVCAIFGILGTPHTLAAVQASGPVALVAPITGTASIRPAVEGKAYFVRGSYSDEVRAIVRHAKAVGLTRFALVYPEDPFGRPVLPVYLDILEKENLKNVLVATVPAVSSNDFAGVVEKLKQTQAEVVIAYLANTFPEFLQSYRDARVTSQLYTLSVAYSARVMEMKSEYVRGVGVTQTTPSPWDETKPVVREFLRDRRSEGGSAPLTFAALEGYVGAKLLVEAIGKDPTAESVHNSLRKITTLDVGGFLVPNQGEGKSSVEIGVLDKRGRFMR